MRAPPRVRSPRLVGRRMDAAILGIIIIFAHRQAHDAGAVGTGGKGAAARRMALRETVLDQMQQSPGRTLACQIGGRVAGQFAAFGRGEGIAAFEREQRMHAPRLIAFPVFGPVVAIGKAGRGKSLGKRGRLASEIGAIARRRIDALPCCDGKGGARPAENLGAGFGWRLARHRAHGVQELQRAIMAVAHQAAKGLARPDMLLAAFGAQVDRNLAQARRADLARRIVRPADGIGVDRPANVGRGKLGRGAGQRAMAGQGTGGGGKAPLGQRGQPLMIGLFRFDLIRRRGLHRPHAKHDRHAQSGRNKISHAHPPLLRRAGCAGNCWRSSRRSVENGGNGWEPERPAANSLRLLPSGPDRVGEDCVRPTPGAHMAAAGANCKRRDYSVRSPATARATSAMIALAASPFSAGRSR